MGTLFSVSGTDGSIITAGAIKSTSTTSGFQPPAMTTTQRNAIVSPTDGLLVYDTTLHQLWEYQNGAWAEVGGGGGSSVTPSVQVIQTTPATSTTGSTYIVTGLTSPFALSNASHKVKISVMGDLSTNGNTAGQAQVTLMMDSTDLDTTGNGLAEVYPDSPSSVANSSDNVGLCILASPGNTSSHTYALYIKQAGTGTAAWSGNNGTTTMILEEVV